MRTRTDAPGIRKLQLPYCDDMDGLIGFALDDEELETCSEYLVMTQERDMPALQEYLHTSCSTEF